MNDWLKSISLLLFPAYVYLISYIYESGYIGYYGFSEQFVEFSPKIFVVTAITVLSCFGLVFLATFYFLLISGVKEISRSVTYFLFLFIFWVLPTLMFWSSARSVIYVTGIFGFLLFMEYAFPLIIEKGTYKQRRKKAARRTHKALDGTLFIKIYSKLGKNAFHKFCCLSLFLVYFPIWVDDLGKFVAERRIEYNTFVTNGQYAIVRVYDNKLLVVGLKDGKHVQSNKIFFLDEIKDVELNKIRSKLSYQTAP